MSSPFVTFPLLLLLGSIFVWFIVYLRKSDTASPLDLITTPDTGRLSAAKIGQLVGVIVSSWVIITSATAGKLTTEIFLCYLAYTAGVDLFGKFLRFKQNMSQEDEKTSEEESNKKNSTSGGNE